MKKLFGIIILLMSGYAAYAGPDSLYRIHIKKAEVFYDKKDYQHSAEEYARAFRAFGDKGYTDDRYNAACSWALVGNVDSAYSNLTVITEKAGFSNYAHFLADTDLDIIRKDKRYKALHDKIKENKEKSEAKLNKPLVKVLNSVLLNDQEYRKAMESIEGKYGVDSKQWKDNLNKMAYYDSVNTLIVVNILDTYGWLGPEEVGRDGARALFLVIQHADIEVQQKYIPMLRQAVKDGKARASALALLEDRVALNTTGKQIYGSQIMRDGNGVYHVSPIEDPENVDKRRAEVGLEPLNDYTQIWNFSWDINAHKKYIKENTNLKKK